LKLGIYLKKILSVNHLNDEIRTKCVDIFEKASSFVGSFVKVQYKHESLSGDFLISRTDYEDISNLLKENKKIPAIKKIRELTGWGLVYAKCCSDFWDFNL
jgi:ribosomal protein L7/L12